MVIPKIMGVLSDNIFTDCISVLPMLLMVIVMLLAVLFLLAQQE